MWGGRAHYFVVLLADALLTGTPKEQVLKASAIGGYGISRQAPDHDLFFPQMAVEGATHGYLEDWVEMLSKKKAKRVLAAPRDLRPYYDLPTNRWNTPFCLIVQEPNQLSLWRCRIGARRWAFKPKHLQEFQSLMVKPKGCEALKDFAFPPGVVDSSSIDAFDAFMTDPKNVHIAKQDRAAWWNVHLTGANPWDFPSYFGIGVPPESNYCWIPEGQAPQAKNSMTASRFAEETQRAIELCEKRGEKHAARHLRQAKVRLELEIDTDSAEAEAMILLGRPVEAIQLFTAAYAAWEVMTPLWKSADSVPLFTPHRFELQHQFLEATFLAMDAAVNQR